MTLKDIKDEALKLMSATGSDYVSKMNGSINRCFSTIEEKRVMPIATKRLELTKESDYRYTYDLSEVFDIDRVVYQRKGVYISGVEYYKEGDTLVMTEYDPDATYILMYYPKIKRITKDEDPVEVPDSIAAFIPYYIKGDLYRDDEPNEAGEARNWFEAAMDSIQNKTTHVKVVTKYTI